MPEVSKLNDSDLGLRNRLAVDRNRWASERTLMAWVRTAFSMITFGFTLVKFFQYLRGDKVEGVDAGVHYLGLAMILAGIASMTVGNIEHWRSLGRLHAIAGSRRTSPALFIGLTVLVLGVSALITGIFRTRSG